MIIELLGLSLKYFSYTYVEKEIKKAKTVSFAVSDETVAFADYKRVVESSQMHIRSIYKIRSFSRQVSTTFEDNVFSNSHYGKLNMLDNTNCELFG